MRQTSRRCPPPSGPRARPATACTDTAFRQATLALGRTPAGGWRLRMQPTGRAYELDDATPLRYQGRAAAIDVAWRQLPVAGVSAEDAAAYARWLDATGRVPGARLCTPAEWQRAARGGDRRPFPHGHALAPTDANVYETYRTEATRAPAPIRSAATRRARARSISTT